MALDVPAIQQALRAESVDAWLWYDFHGSNPIATRLAGLADGGKMTTRRWFYAIPGRGTPRGLVHAIERHNLDALPGVKQVYASRHQLEAGLRDLLAGCRRVAMEYSPRGAIPYLSRVDAGTAEAVRELGIELVCSGDLVQRFEAVWDAPAVASHRRASDHLYRIKDRAFDLIGQRLRGSVATTELDVQQAMVDWFGEAGLVSESAPVVASQEHAGDPHFLPTADRTRAIGHDELVLLDLWGKLPDPGSVYADITWVGYTGAEVPRAYAKAFAAVRAARDEAVAAVRSAARDGQALRGWEVDRVARGVLEGAGYGAHILHRTGHSLGEAVHGNGVHLDDYETHDDRRLLPGTGFTIEPGLYFEGFGVRTEINVVLDTRDAVVTGPQQTEIVTLA